MFACAYGAAFGAIQHIPRMIPGLAEVKAKADAAVAAATKDKPPADQKKIAAQTRARVTQSTAADVTKVQELGGLAGRFLLAILAVHIVSRRALVRIFQVPGLIVMPVVFAICATTRSAVAVFRDLFRRPADGRAVQFLGKLSAARLSAALARHRRKFCRQHRRPADRHVFRLGDGDTRDDYRRRLCADQAGVHGGAVGFAVFLGGFILSFFLPEPKSEDLKE